MTSDVLQLVRAARRKLLLTRAAEAACLCAALCGLAGCAAPAALLLGRLAFWAPWALWVAVASAAGSLGFRAVRRRLDLPIAQAVAVWAVVAGLLAWIAAWALSGQDGHAWRWLGPVAGLLGGAAAGASAVLLQGVSLTGTARTVDASGRLPQSLSAATATALAGDDGPAARYVRRQALARLGPGTKGLGGMWMRSGLLPAALAVVVLFAGALLAVPGPRPAADLPDRVADRLAQLTPTQRDRLAQALREAMDTSESALADAALRRAADAVQRVDPDTLREALEQLAEEGLSLEDLLGRDVLAMAGGGDDEPSGRVADGAGRDQGPTAREGPEPPLESVGVYDPLFEGAAPPGSPEAAPNGAGGWTPAADAWRRARARAMDRLRRGRVPAGRRRLVYDYFRLREEASVEPGDGV